MIIPEPETLAILAACLLTGFVIARLVGRSAWTWPMAAGLGAVFAALWLSNADHGLYVMGLGVAASVALGLRRSFALRRQQEAALEREIERRGALAPVGAWAWIWHGAGLGAAFATFWILLAMVFLGGPGFDGARLAVFGFYALYLFTSTGVLRRFSPPPLSRLTRIVGRGLFARRAA